ncbi:class I SAM-dependent methyltransferase [Mycolicibacterium cosmeticum]|uniref:Type 11 methyltransferase n=1 Tax=Mycolicibacterium cosmeticum TaxID=258533 RepID=W9BM61_MYCCO|nr:methyltransferase domain-containing protein [Mycolicibacterium cosmeticum]CDO10840.1 type 11 methyltransferase [Mycolicibacterium cosmeticum]
MSATEPIPTVADDDRRLKAKHRALWASGDYPAIAAELIAELGPQLVHACDIRPGHRVLDVAAGTGNAAIPAAAAGGIVTASDLTPELFEAGRRIATLRNVDLEWVEADAEAMPFADNSFDVVMSCVGVMFAPRHRAVADELIRVCRHGGTIGMINWTPDGFIGAMLSTIGPYAPTASPAAAAPPMWGDEQHVRNLFGDRLIDLKTRRQVVLMDRSGTPLDFREYWKRNYGPIIAAYRFNHDKPESVAELDTQLLDLLERWNRSSVSGRVVYPAEYLLITAVKREGKEGNHV